MSMPGSGSDSDCRSIPMVEPAVRWPSGRSADGGIDEVPLPAGTPGRLWLCGKYVVGPDPEAALAAVGATTIVCLVERQEIADRYPDYAAWLECQPPSRAVVFPIPDLHMPPADDPSVAEFLDDLVARVIAGDGLIVHCAAGIGRSGTTAVAMLLRLGVALPAALTHVRAHRPMGGPEVGAQLDFVTQVARSVAAGLGGM
jgi:protein-tyrosine phosphatase